MRGLYIITGKQGSGKSEMIQAICSALVSKSITVSGIIAKGKWENSERSGFEIESILTGESMVLCENKYHPSWVQFKRFWFNPEAIIAGNIWLTKALESNTCAILLDEIGPLELQGEGWAKKLLSIFAQSQQRLVIVTIRQTLTEEAISVFNLKPMRIIDASEDKVLVIKEITKIKEPE